MSLSTRLVAGLSSLALLAAAAPASAQGGGFVAGDMYIYSPFLTGTGNHDNGLLRIDPATGAASTHLLLDGQVTFTGMLAFDPYRQRLLTQAAPQGSGSSVKRLQFVDGAGAVTESGWTGGTWRSFAPVGDGRIYFHDDTSNVQPFKWLDAANRVHVLMDATGSVPFEINGNGSIDVNGMLYVPEQNCLLAASNFNCSNVQVLNLLVHRLQLSADGTRVIADTCDDLFVDSSAATARGFSRNAAGQVFLVADTNQSGKAPRMALVDPTGPVLSPWAQNGPYVGTNTVPAGCWSSRVGKLLITHASENKLRGYAFGEEGLGSHEVTVSLDYAQSTEGATLIDIPFSGDTGGWIAHGKGLAGAGGRVPGLWGTGNPEPGAAFTLRVDEVVGGAVGTLFVGLASAAAPFKGGTLHVGAVQLNVALAVGGASGQPGAGTLALPGALPPDAGLTGVSIFLQAGFSDAAAVKGVSLTQGLELEIG